MTEKISIHALREEGDIEWITKRPKLLRFQSTPSARRATRFFGISMLYLLFQSTPSARRATNSFRFTAIPLTISIHALREEGDGRWQAPRWTHQYFNPRPPRGGRHKAAVVDIFQHRISIHALREEGDMMQFSEV